MSRKEKITLGIIIVIIVIAIILWAPQIFGNCPVGSEC